MSISGNDKAGEALSSLVDGEASEFELHHLLSRCESDGALRDKWSRYQTIGAILRKEHSPTTSNTALFDGVSQAIRNESYELESYSSEGKYSENRTNKAFSASDFLGKTAVAASVAAAFVFGFNQFQSFERNDDALIGASSQTVEPATQIESLEAPAGFNLPLPQSRVVSSNASRSNVHVSSLSHYSAEKDLNTKNWQENPEFRQYLNSLVIEHAEQNTQSSGLGLLPISRVSELPVEASE